MIKKDYIIVGQGLAGTVLALTFMKEGMSVMIIDDLPQSSASKIAAGLYNPVVFKRLVKSWMADDLIPFMDKFYGEAESLLNTEFYNKKKIVKLFAEENEREFWLKKSKENVGKYLSKDIYDNFLECIVNAPLGASEVIEAGNLNTGLFLNSSREYFKTNDAFIAERFDYGQLKISDDHVSYQGVMASKIIFCEGYKVSENPYFDWLPFKLTKGEILTIKLSQNDIIPEDKVINKGVFILPIGNNTYKVGSTYEWNELNENTTEKGRKELIDKLNKVLKVPYEIIEHSAGIRPTVNDRRPILGLHPQHSVLVVFNGLGTKGVMLAPFFAQQLVDFLEKGLPLDAEINITRFI
ncbi:MAG: FAD-dependent oxidoreductase [Bacteroidetes bacterium]|jgi:glycine/D-amino acid oxidase-like deaminating enzyme|nr:FAD-dependent oxidoreductase [Bacteroidota bacterium]